MSGYPYNKSILVTSRSIIPGSNLYKIPNQSHFNAIACNQVFITNSNMNVVGHEIVLTKGSTPVTINIPDGLYTGDEYASTVQQLLRDQFTSWGNGTDVSVNFVHRVDGDYRLVIYNQNDTAVFHWLPNISFGQFTGFSDENPATINPHTTVTINSDVPPSFIPRYYTIRSNSLSGFGFDHNQNQGSNIIAVVPIDYSKAYTIWQNSDIHLHTLHSDVYDLAHTMDITICFEESHIGLVDPNFAITFVTSLY